MIPAPLVLWCVALQYLEFAARSCLQYATLAPLWSYICLAVGDSSTGISNGSHLDDTVAALQAAQAASDLASAQPPQAAAPQPTGRLRKLAQVASRGCRLCDMAGGGGGGGGTTGSATSSGNGPGTGRSNGSISSGPPQVLLDDPCDWVWFRGNWGQIDAPIEQPWFHCAECPVSRAPLLRLFGHFVPERACVK